MGTLLVALLVLLLHLPAFARAGPSGKTAIRVKALESKVQVRSRNSYRYTNLQLHTPLHAGDLIITGPKGFVALETNTGFFIRLKEHSTVAIAQSSDSLPKLRYISGSVYVSSIEDRGYGISFALVTGESVQMYGLGAFRIDRNDAGGATVTVREGQVRVLGRGGEKGVAEGEAAWVNRGFRIIAAVPSDSWDSFVEKRDADTLGYLGKSKGEKRVSGYAGPDDYTGGEDKNPIYGEEGSSSKSEARASYTYRSSYPYTPYYSYYPPYPYYSYGYYPYSHYPYGYYGYAGGVLITGYYIGHRHHRSIHRHRGHRGNVTRHRRSLLRSRSHRRGHHRSNSHGIRSRPNRHFKLHRRGSGNRVIRRNNRGRTFRGSPRGRMIERSRMRNGRRTRMGNRSGTRMWNGGRRGSRR